MIKEKKIKKLDEIIDNTEMDIFAMEEVSDTKMRLIKLVDKINEIINRLNN